VVTLDHRNSRIDFNSFKRLWHGKRFVCNEVRSRGGRTRTEGVRGEGVDG